MMTAPIANRGGPARSEGGPVRGLPRLWGVCVAALAAVVLGLPVAAATLSLPPDAGAPPGQSTIVPLLVDAAEGFLGTDILILYAPTVVSATAVIPTALSASHTLTVNLTVPGEIRISLYGAEALSGGGSLVDVEWTAVGPIGSQSPLQLAAVEVNEGQIPAAAQDGQFCVQGQPAETQGLLLDRTGPGSTTLLSWTADPFAESYNIHRAEQPDLSDLACFQTGVTGTSTVDDGTVAPGGLYLFLASTVNCFAEGTLGFSSSGMERLPVIACP